MHIRSFHLLVMATFELFTFGPSSEAREKSEIAHSQTGKVVWTCYGTDGARISSGRGGDRSQAEFDARANCVITGGHHCTILDCLVRSLDAERVISGV